MKIEKLYSFSKWTDWKHKLSESIDDFFNNYSYYPNILEANRHTHSQLDFLVNEMPNEKQNLSRLNEITNKVVKPEKDEWVYISSYETIKTTVDFAVDVNLKDKQFRLIYDSDPDWDNRNRIIDTPVEKSEKSKIKIVQ